MGMLIGMNMSFRKYLCNVSQKCHRDLSPVSLCYLLYFHRGFSPPSTSILLLLNSIQRWLSNICWWTHKLLGEHFRSTGMGWTPMSWNPKTHGKEMEFFFSKCLLIFHQGVAYDISQAGLAVLWPCVQLNCSVFLVSTILPVQLAFYIG